ncbi:MAG TPA: DUF1295 domain-containing protein, partial [Spirochaetia bacterium]|nr:DUF1295 domain-containing protein [Spirochaetia bacterium]
VTFKAAAGNPLVSASVTAAATGDIAATVVVFIFSVIFNNSSVYDPYWSVAPPVIAGYWIVMGFRAGTPLGIGGLLIVACLLVWAGRLTFNWARGWRGFSHEDWRYVDFRATAGRAYWIVSFLGIHLFPTVLVFLGCLSLLPVLAEPRHSLDALWIAGVLISATAIWIEARADHELFEFKKRRSDNEEILDSGLWSYTRHPNYFGEVLFWWGIYIVGLAANPDYWWTIFGPVAITLLFLFVSVPMMERHMIERHPSYETLRFERSRFVPWFRR